MSSLKGFKIRYDGVCYLWAILSLSILGMALTLGWSDRDIP